MTNIIPYDPTISLALEAGSILIDLYDNYENRNLQIKLYEIQDSIQKSINKKEIIESSISSIAQVCTIAIESYTKLQLFEKTLSARQKDIEYKMQIFDRISNIVDLCNNMIKNGVILIDTSKLNPDDKAAAIKIRNSYFNLQDKYLDAVGKFI